MNSKYKMVLMAVVVSGFFLPAHGQQADSVVIRVGKESKVVFLIKDKKDLETLKHYDFQALMDDMVKKLEARDSTAIVKPSSEYLKDTAKMAVVEQSSTNWADKNTEENNNNYNRKSQRKWRGRRTHHSFNIDLGMNNYLQNGQFPDATNELYSVKPWGSWYVGFNSVLRTHVTGSFFLEWGAGVTWYNFKYSNFKTVMTKDDNGVIFSEDTRDKDFLKSKLTAAFVNASLVPMFDFGDNSRKSTFFDNHHSNSFRIGAGPYVGYLIDSYSKTVYQENGNKVKAHDHDNFYLNNIRYGLRLQLGFRDTDIFFNYDLNNLYTDGKGPKLQAFSFGITL